MNQKQVFSKKVDVASLIYKDAWFYAWI
jgi:hypothetical protein